MNEYAKGYLQSSDGKFVNMKLDYVDLCGGSITDAVLFSQIMYWHGNKKDGQPRMSIMKEGQRWLAKAYSDWWAECRVTERMAKKVIDRLVKIGLIIKKVFGFAGKRTTHIRINWEYFSERMQHLEAQPENDAKYRNGTLTPPQSTETVLSNTESTYTENTKRSSDSHDAVRAVSQPNTFSPRPSEIKKELALPEKAEPKRETTVVHFDEVKALWDDQATVWSEPDLIYIGSRVGRMGLKESNWRTPFSIEDEHVRVDDPRAYAIKRFRTYILSRPTLLARLHELEGKRLVCWCKPEDCHGDVLVALLKAGYARFKGVSDSGTGVQHAVMATDDGDRTLCGRNPNAPVITTHATVTCKRCLKTMQGVWKAVQEKQSSKHKAMVDAIQALPDAPMLPASRSFSGKVAKELLEQGYTAKDIPGIYAYVLVKSKGWDSWGAANLSKYAEGYKRAKIAEVEVVSKDVAVSETQVADPTDYQTYAKDIT